MRTDRFLLGILIATGLLVLTALIVFFLRQPHEGYLEGGGPREVVNNYVVALRLGDFERAAGFLARNANTPDARKMQADLAMGQTQQIRRLVVEIGEPTTQEEEAWVPVKVIFPGFKLVDNPSGTSFTALLARQNGEWRIREMPYPFWSYAWSDPVIFKE